MKWSDLPIHPTSKVLRQFAAAWLGFFFGIGLYQWLGNGRAQLGLFLCAMAIGIGVPGLFKPATLRWLFVGWMVLAFPIGWLISHIALVILFYGIITPGALFFRMRGRDLLSLKPAPKQPTFWVSKPAPSNVRSYLRQY